MVLFSVYRVVAKRADYTRTASGWRGEFRGPFTVRVDAHDVESCRDALFGAVEAKVVEWLTGEQSDPVTSDATNTAPE